MIRHLCRLTPAALMKPDFERELDEFMRELADLSAAAILPQFRRAIEVEDKGAGARFDPVTRADRDAERAIRRAIAARYPDHGISGEEFADRPGAAEFRWIIDPIDGTQAFICGLPTWATLVGLCDAGGPVYGMMNQPFVGERFIGGFGRAVVHDAQGERRLRCSAVAQPDRATLFATSPSMFAPGPESSAFRRLSDAVRVTRFGVDAYAYCLLAAGYVDLVVEAGLGFYDIAPLMPIVEAAGGIVSDWSGAPVRSGGQVIAAANVTLHAQALDYLNAG